MRATEKQPGVTSSAKRGLNFLAATWRLCANFQDTQEMLLGWGKEAAAGSAEQEVGLHQRPGILPNWQNWETRPKFAQMKNP